MDILAGIVELIGLWVVGNKNRISFILFIVCNLLWIYVAFSKHIYGLLIVSIPALLINTRNFIKWGKDENTISSTK